MSAVHAPTRQRPRQDEQRAGADVRAGVHADRTERGSPGSTPLLTTIWLDADATTYEALCTAGATSITAVLTAPQSEDMNANHTFYEDDKKVGVASVRQVLCQLIPQECHPRKRPRGATEEPSGCNIRDDGAIRAGTERISSVLAQPPGDADARLDVLEEVELCSVVPRLTRTFGMQHLVQQVVPCTAFFAPRTTSPREHRNGCLAHLRAAADRHMSVLRTDGGVSASSYLSSTLTTPSTAVSEGEGGGTETKGAHRRVRAWLPAIPVCMRVTSLDLSGREGREDEGEREGVVREQTEEHSGGLVSVSRHNDAPPSAPLLPSSSPAPSRAPRIASSSSSSVEVTLPTWVGQPRQRPVLHLGLRGVQCSACFPSQHGRETDDGSVAPPPLPLRSADGGDEVEEKDGCDTWADACFSFAAAQARYEAQREAQTGTSSSSHHSGYCSSQDASRATPSFPIPGAAVNCSTEGQSTTAAVSGTGPPPVEAEKERQRNAAVSAAATRLHASTATYFSSHPASTSSTSSSTAAAAAIAASLYPFTDIDGDVSPLPVPPHHEEDAALGCSTGDGGGLQAAPHSLLPPPPSPSLPVAQPAGAVVEWVTGVVSYTADTAGLMQEQQARVRRGIFLPPPLPTTAAITPAHSGGGGATHVESPREDRATLRGVVLAQLQRLRRRDDANRVACHEWEAAARRRRDAAHITTTDTASASSFCGLSAGAGVCGGALPCPCIACCPLELQFAQVPPMASTTLRRYLEALHQTAVPSLQQPFPPPHSLRTDFRRSVAAAEQVRASCQVAVDPLESFFPALRQWCVPVAETETPRGGSASAGASTSPLEEEGEKSSAGKHQWRQQRRSRSPRTEHAGDASSPDIVAPFGGIDDAVLDETVVVGMVPRGQPHQLRLVAPSRAFVHLLVQRLEEVGGVAVRILANLSLPVDSASGDETQDRAAAGAAGEWQAWLEYVYFSAVWSTLEAELTRREWDMTVQVISQLPAVPLATFLHHHDHRSDPSHAHLAHVPLFLQGLLAAEEHAAGLNGGRGGTSLRAVITRVSGSVRTAAVMHTTACISAAEDAAARVMLTALTPLLHRRITVMYELLRHSTSPSLYASHRAQCEAYQQWYATTPSPGAVLRLLQRSHRLRHALARCYPQYNALPPAPAQHAERRGAAMPCPAGPLPAALVPQANGAAVPHRAGSGKGRKGLPTSSAHHRRRRGGGDVGDEDVKMKVEAGVEEEGETAVHPPLVPLPLPDTEATTTTATSASTAGTDSRDHRSTWSTEHIPWSPPVPVYPATTTASTPTTTATIAAAAAAHAQTPPPSSPSRPSSPQPESLFTTAEGGGGLLYVPEVALLDPRYLQRFAWWTHRTHHNSSNNNHNHSAATGGSAPSWSPHSPVMRIPGDYLRVVPLHEQDAAIRAVLRAMTQKGRTLDLWEMSQYMQAHGHTSYVYL